MCFKVMPNTIETIKYFCLPAHGLGTTRHPTAVLWVWVWVWAVECRIHGDKHATRAT